MEVFGLKSQSLKYSMGGFGSVQLYLTPEELGIVPRHAMAAPNPSSKAVLVVGASRGIGFQLVDQLSQQPHHHIIASVRSDAGLDNPSVQAIRLDQSSPDSVKAAAAQVKELDTIIVNAAIGDNEKLLNTSDERMAEYMDVNVTGVLRGLALDAGADASCASSRPFSPPSGPARRAKSCSSPPPRAPSPARSTLKAASWAPTPSRRLL